MRPTLHARAFATLVALWLVVGGVLGARHEALVGHHVDAHTGIAVHAPGVVGHHTSDRSDVHRSRALAGDDGDGCAIVAALHAAATAALAIPALACAGSPAAIVAPPRAPATLASARILRFAPKTSPPRATVG